MKKNIFCLIIGLFVVCTTSTASAKILGIVIDIVKDEITITYETKTPKNDVIEGHTIVWISVNEKLLTVGSKGYKLQGSGVKTIKLNHDLMAKDKFKIISYDSFKKKSTYDEFDISRNVYTIYY